MKNQIKHFKARYWRLVQFPKGNCTVMVDEIVFLLVPKVPTSANWPAGKGAQIGGAGTRAWGWQVKEE